MTLDIQITDQDLPVLSAVASQALDLMQDPNATNRKLEDLIKQDPALTERVLVMANSVFYVGKVQTQSISGAIMRLGLRQLRSVIVAAATSDLFNAEDPVAQKLWEHCTLSASACHIIAEKLALSNTDEAFIAGMLHDVGKLIIYQQFPVEYGQMIERAHTSGRRIHDVENEELQFFNHMSIGGLVIRKWKLPDILAETARFHHDVEIDASIKLINPTLVHLVATANLVVHQLMDGAEQEQWEAVEQAACAQKINFTKNRRAEVCEAVLQSIEAQRMAAGA